VASSFPNSLILGALLAALSSCGTSPASGMSQTTGVQTNLQGPRSAPNKANQIRATAAAEVTNAREGKANANNDTGYLFTSFDPPGSIITFPFGINNTGLIAIQYVDGNGTNHAATLKDGVYKVIDVPGAEGTLASAPNNSGQVVLTYFGADFVYHAALFSRGQFTAVPDVPGEQNNSASAINDRGEIDGVAWTGSPFGVVHSYIFDGRTYTLFDHPLTDIPQTIAGELNDRGQIVGQYNMQSGAIHGFLRDADGVFTEIAFPGAPNTAAFGINNSGDIVGLWGEAGTGPFGFAVGSQGFLLSKGRFTTVAYPGAVSSFPLGLNDIGQLVGVYTDAQGTFHGYLATPSH
jgi:uncharacterized membrane protein